MQRCLLSAAAGQGSGSNLIRSPALVVATQSEAEAQETLISLPPASKRFVHEVPLLEEAKMRPWLSVAAEGALVQVAALSSPAPEVVGPEPVALPPGAIGSYSGLAVLRTAVQV